MVNLLKVYYIQVRSYDGLDYSPVTEQILNLTSTSSNTKPTPPKTHSPESTTDQQPTITWSGAEDADNDTLKYYIQIGTEEYSNDILPWAFVGKNQQVLLESNMEDWAL